MNDRPVTGMLHHVELWVPDLPRAVASWQWLLESLGYTPFQEWSDGRSWRSGATYVVLEQSPALSADRHERRRPGLNHLAFHGGSRAEVDALVERAPAHGWTLMFPDRHPYAGGERHYAAYLEDRDGFEVELVAFDAPEPMQNYTSEYYTSVE
ncbi:VOC family protein [Nonomuraea phyllanthi]|uniref:VOC family protein n=1 Tax=Nonomuraea phyllanthi TaxID=2219224 RepID=UPI001D149DC7|nr:VOC family protein [Nonomuraea phyllanthi]